jgi:hypothetical protein
MDKDLAGGLSWAQVSDLDPHKKPWTVNVSFRLLWQMSGNRIGQDAAWRVVDPPGDRTLAFFLGSGKLGEHPGPEREPRCPAAVDARRTQK